MHSSLFLVTAAVAGALAAPGVLEARTDVCQKTDCYLSVLAYAVAKPAFCALFVEDKCLNEVTNFVDADVKSACSCIMSSTSIPAPTTTLAQSNTQTPPVATTTAGVSVTSQISGNKCKATKSTGSGSVTSTLVASTPAETSPAASTLAQSTQAQSPAAQSTPTQSPTTLKSIPTTTPSGPAGTCPKPDLPGGLFSVLGSLEANAGLKLSSTAGSCSANVYAGSSASAKIASRTSSVSASVELSTCFAGSNFLQIAADVAASTAKVCQQVSLCQGKQYKLSVLAAAEAGADVQLQFSVDAGLQLSPTKSCSAGAGVAASFDFDFEWTAAAKADVEVCVLTTIPNQHQCCGLSKFVISEM